MDAKIWMTSLIIMFAVRPICVQDSIFKMSSESPGYDKDNAAVSCDFCVIPAANACWRHCRASWHEAAQTRHNQKTPMESLSASDYPQMCIPDSLFVMVLAQIKPPFHWGTFWVVGLVGGCGYNKDFEFGFVERMHQHVTTCEYGINKPISFMQWLQPRCSEGQLQSLPNDVLEAGPIFFFSLTTSPCDIHFLTSWHVQLS